MNVLFHEILCFKVILVARLPPDGLPLPGPWEGPGHLLWDQSHCSWHSRLLRKSEQSEQRSVRHLCHREKLCFVTCFPQAELYDIINKNLDKVTNPKGEEKPSMYWSWRADRSLTSQSFEHVLKTILHIHWIPISTLLVWTLALNFTCTVLCVKNKTTNFKKVFQTVSHLFVKKKNNKSKFFFPKKWFMTHISLTSSTN